MRRALLTVAIAAASAVALSAQFIPTPAPGPYPAAVQSHVDKAKTAADGDLMGLFTPACNTALALVKPPLPRAGGPARGRRGGGPPIAPPRAAWHHDPVKVFDNMYFVGMTEYSSWAVTTSQGIILLDSIFDYSVQDEVDEGLRKVGLNPADIKYVIVSHGHLDHAGGAKYLQDKYGAHLIMSAADYDLLDQQNPPWKPKRDMVATDGMKVTLGDETITLYLTPGHTLGTVSMIVPLRDHGQPHVAAYWGGTLFNFGPILPRLKQYADSAARFRTIAAKAGADIILSNHTEYDGSKTKLPAVAARKAGAPNPYVVGTGTVQRYLTVAGECAQAAVAGLESK
ncbi:MAG TPA: MBL fold metallo-hydrolase [Vicinamibacterales bacterium]|nr:MBL fold metallo-hydrolase [Vicinamibacterales bacterium]